ncbi:class I SAM-dependent methyltransferase [Chloroflexota bacterium]
MAEFDWLELWRKLASTAAQAKNGQRVRRYELHSRSKTRERPDPLLEFVLQNINSQSTLLDVGAGSGRWTIPAAKIAKSVTAVEPSEAMLSMLRENITTANLNNIRTLQARWEEVIAEPHDVVVCAHAIYASQDFAGFVRKMEQYARERCYLELRLLPHNGIIGELSLSINGHRHDSPNAIMAYNALYSMGIYANVLVEDGIHCWVDSTFEEAFARAKRHLHLESSAAHDELIRDVLARRLTHLNNSYIWPDGMRSALLWWSPSVVYK